MFLLLIDKVYVIIYCTMFIITDLPYSFVENKSCYAADKGYNGYDKIIKYVVIIMVIHYHWQNYDYDDDNDSN